MRSLTIGLATLVVAASGAFAQVGQPLPQAELEGFANTEARSLGDFQGRLLALEFFAYW